MEYVEGEHLDPWCDARKLSIPERLRLFLQARSKPRTQHDARDRGTEANVCQGLFVLTLRAKRPLPTYPGLTFRRLSSAEEHDSPEFSAALWYQHWSRYHADRLRIGRIPRIAGAVILPGRRIMADLTGGIRCGTAEQVSLHFIRSQVANKA